MEFARFLLPAKVVLAGTREGLVRNHPELSTGDADVAEQPPSKP
jgi:hypothetical protein